jgi:hypothetical protein
MLLRTPAVTASRLVSRLPRSGWTAAVASLVMFAAMGCDKVPLTAPAGTVITLVSSTNVVPINGSTELIAVLIENGTTGTGTNVTGSAGTPVHNGTLVTFTTSLGRIEPVEARTSNGRVTVTLKADGRSGRATVTAFSGSASETLEVLIGAAAAERVSVTASPTSVPSNGGTVTISARVEDASGNPLNGVPVTFSTTTGTLATQSALTNESGFATTTLSTTTAATVTANSGGKTSTAAITVRSRSTITVTPPASPLVVGSPATFTVTPGAGVAMRNVTIDFGDGQSRELGAISSATTVQHYYTDDGLFQVEVTGEDVDGGTAEASAGVAVVPFTFSVTSSSGSNPVDTIFTFTVTELPASVPIDRYVWNFGDGQVQTTTSKSITHAYQSPGLKTITVTVYPLRGDPKSATLQVIVTPTS